MPSGDIAGADFSVNDPDKATIYRLNSRAEYVICRMSSPPTVIAGPFDSFEAAQAAQAVILGDN